MTRGQRWAFAATLLVGITFGLGAFTFGYAKGYSYLGHDPAACANCHVMSDHYRSWMGSSHHAVAGCNDCHTPHDVVGKYYTKALNGFWHSFYFTTGTYPDPIRITSRNRSVTEGACRHCHEPITDAIEHGTSAPATPSLEKGHAKDEEISCIRCHRNVGHSVR
jgi:cytochrome c nitrite reductase small subunit